MKRHVDLDTLLVAVVIALLSGLAIGSSFARGATPRSQAEPVPSWTPVELPSEAPDWTPGASPSSGPAAASEQPVATVATSVPDSSPRPTRTPVAGNTAPRRTAAPTKAPTMGWSTAIASWYGSESYGNRTACGQVYGPATWGVAHKTLRCGTLIQFRYGGRTVTAPVVDRGPYIAGRTWDLTNAVAVALHFDGVHRVEWRAAG